MNILWIIVAVLLAVWLAGLFLELVGAVIHVVLIIAIAVAIYAFIKRKAT